MEASYQATKKDRVNALDARALSTNAFTASGHGVGLRPRHLARRGDDSSRVWIHPVRCGKCGQRMSVPPIGRWLCACFLRPKTASGGRRQVQRGRIRGQCIEHPIRANAKVGASRVCNRGIGGKTMGRQRHHSDGIARQDFECGWRCRCIQGESDHQHGAVHPDFSAGDLDASGCVLNGVAVGGVGGLAGQRHDADAAGFDHVVFRPIGGEVQGCELLHEAAMFRAPCRVVVHGMGWDGMGWVRQ